jgi:tRNA dimethylallyltransferase
MSDEAVDALAVVGPTASGKSDLALKLALALGGEIVNADSVQVYRRFDIGSGKPSLEERELVPHHLLDVRDAKDPMEASQFQALAESTLADIRRRGAVPIVAGGTFLWLRALIYGLAEAPGASNEVRRQHQLLVESQGREALHSALERVDPDSAARLHPRDYVRVSRALEVFETSGRRLSEVQNEHGFRTPRQRVLLISIGHDRELYEQRLARRTRSLFERGFVAEVEELVRLGYGETRAMASIGYRQVKEALLGPVRNEEVLIQEVLKKTRVFARRQRTWLRDEKVLTLAPSCLEGLDEATLGSLRRRLGLE